MANEEKFGIKTTCKQYLQLQKKKGAELPEDAHRLLKRNMIIQEVLEADWTVTEIDITVREKESTKYIMRYCIGRDAKPGKSQRFHCETKLGDVYKNSGMSTLYMKRIIQFRQLEKKPQGKEMCVGVLTEKIPKELLELEVEQMSPYCLGRSDEFHGYRFQCYVDFWNGIPGEYEQMSLDFPEVMP